MGKKKATTISTWRPGPGEDWEEVATLLYDSKSQALATFKEMLEDNGIHPKAATGLVSQLQRKGSAKVFYSRFAIREYTLRTY